jgi:dipeptidyl aminopeptidase/acylaminoacyl peptidase
MHLSDSDPRGSREFPASPIALLLKRRFAAVLVGVTLVFGADLPHASFQGFGLQAAADDGTADAQDGNAQDSASNRPSVRRTINQQISATWQDDTSFTYQKQLPEGGTQWVRVDAVTGEQSIVRRDEESGRGLGLRGGPLPSSQGSADDTYLEFDNRSGEAVELFWLDTGGRPQSYGMLDPGEKRSQHTFSGHAWMVRGESGEFYGSLVAPANRGPVIIEKTFQEPPRRRSPRRGRNRDRQAWRFSADRSHEVRIDAGRLQIRATEPDDSDWQTLGEVGGDDVEWANPTWSPDGSLLAVWRVTRHPAPKTYLIESSPDEGGRAKLQQRPYYLPGDPFDEYELVVFDAGSAKRLPVEFPVIDFGRPRVRWLGDHRFAVSKVDRGHQRFRLFVVDPVEGSIDTVIDETTDTFIWTMHGPKVPLLTYLDDSEQVIYCSERSGYRHLYLVDLTGQREMKPITSGDFLVREILHLDEPQGYVDLLVGEFHDDQDPYHRHLVRVDLNGDSFVSVTDGDGDHTVEFSPTREFAVVTHSRVDSPPVHELRRMSDGALITELMTAERVGPQESTWSLPKVFHSAGRDGETEIWGNVYFPPDFDPKAKKQYPILEAIYAGPHDSHVPKRYLHGSRFKSLTELGFVVVQIDGMGTANRSKAFHDVCWQNLKDAGFPDRIAWMKALAKTYPALDTSRVGIYGTSAGGQNACGAVLFHGDFYKAAYASCGCHDNRMDKASWNEQWMGVPVGPHYAASSNIDNADRLSGDLFLVVGELDRNVPPESTLRLVDALVEADKDFEFLLIPGMGHSDGGEYGRRRMREFFVKTLSP